MSQTSYFYLIPNLKLENDILSIIPSDVSTTIIPYHETTFASFYEWTKERISSPME